jgi:hypothetical protein
MANTNGGGDGGAAPWTVNIRRNEGAPISQIFLFVYNLVYVDQADPTPNPSIILLSKLNSGSQPIWTT